MPERITYWTKYNGNRQLDIRAGGRVYGIRIGRPDWYSFSERYQGVHGIPRCYWYAFGGRVTFIRRREARP